MAPPYRPPDAVLEIGEAPRPRWSLREQRAMDVHRRGAADARDDYLVAGGIPLEHGAGGDAELLTNGRRHRDLPLRGEPRQAADARWLRRAWQLGHAGILPR